MQVPQCRLTIRGLSALLLLLLQCSGTAATSIPYASSLQDHVNVTRAGGNGGALQTEEPRETAPEPTPPAAGDPRSVTSYDVSQPHGMHAIERGTLTLQLLRSAQSAAEAETLLLASNDEDSASGDDEDEPVFADRGHLLMDCENNVCSGRRATIDDSAAVTTEAAPVQRIRDASFDADATMAAGGNYWAHTVAQVLSGLHSNRTPVGQYADDAATADAGEEATAWASATSGASQRNASVGVNEPSKAGTAIPANKEVLTSLHQPYSSATDSSRTKDTTTTRSSHEETSSHEHNLRLTVPSTLGEQMSLSHVQPRNSQNVASSKAIHLTHQSQSTITTDDSHSGQIVTTQAALTATPPPASHEPLPEHNRLDSAAAFKATTAIVPENSSFPTTSDNIATHLPDRYASADALMPAASGIQVAPPDPVMLSMSASDDMGESMTSPLTRRAQGPTLSHGQTAQQFSTFDVTGLGGYSSSTDAEAGYHTSSSLPPATAAKAVLATLAFRPGSTLELRQAHETTNSIPLDGTALELSRRQPHNAIGGVALTGTGISITAVPVNDLGIGRPAVGIDNTHRSAMTAGEHELPMPRTWTSANARTADFVPSSPSAEGRGDMAAGKAVAVVSSATAAAPEKTMSTTAAPITRQVMDSEPVYSSEVEVMTLHGHSTTTVRRQQPLSLMTSAWTFRPYTAHREVHPPNHHTAATAANGLRASPPEQPSDHAATGGSSGVAAETHFASETWASTAAVVGTAVGCTAVCGTLLGLTVWLVRRRRLRAQHEEKQRRRRERYARHHTEHSCLEELVMLELAKARSRGYVCDSDKVNYDEVFNLNAAISNQMITEL